MEFPQNLLTNIYKIDNIDVIHWGTFSRENDSEHTITGILCQAEMECRRAGQNVHIDHSALSLWSFWPTDSNSATNTHEEQKHLAATLSTKYGLARTKFGVLQAHDLYSARSSVAHIDIKAINQARFQQNRSGIAMHPRNGEQLAFEDLKNIYSKFVSSALLSLTFHLAQQRNYIPFGLDSLIKPCHLEPSGLGSSTLELLTIDFQWGTTCSIAISQTSRRAEGMEQISSILEHGATSEEIKALSGKTLTVAPICRDATLECIENERTTHGEHWKYCLVDSLAQRGICLSDHTCWVWIRWSDYSSMRILKTLQSLPEADQVPVLWPAQLCFSCPLGPESDVENPQWLFKESAPKDPLLEAEKWFKGREARNRNISEKVRKTEEERNAVNRESLDAAKIPSYADLHANNSIYPTPPNGFHPIADEGSHSITLSQNKHSPLPSDDTPKCHDEVILKEDHDDPHLSNAEPSVITVEAQYTNENEDLFEDMDAETFVNNELTDADFSFFDEHDMDTSKIIMSDSLVDDVPKSNEQQEFVLSIGDENSNNLIIRGEATPVLLGLSEISAHSSPRGAISQPANISQQHHFSSTPKVHEMRQLDQPRETQIVQQSPAKPIQRKPSLFATIQYHHEMEDTDQKYAKTGRFDFTRPPTPDSILALSNQSPEKPFPSRLDLEAPTTSEPCLTDQENSSLESDQEVPTSRKRKRNEEDDYLEATTNSQQMPSNTLESTKYSRIVYPDPSILLSQYMSAVSSICGEYSFSEHAIHTALNDMDYIEVAQIVAEQLTNNGFSFSENVNLPRSSPSLADNASLAVAVYELYGQGVRCDLKTYAELGKKSFSDSFRGRQSSLIDPGRFARGSPRAKSQHNISRHDAPFICLKRNGLRYETLNSLLPYWEIFGCAPYNGSKDVKAYCVYPSNEAVSRGVDSLLDMIGSAYQGCNFGSHQRGITAPGTTTGMIPVEVKFGNERSIARSYVETCETFGQWLSQQPLQGRNIVIYLVQPFDDSRLLADLCASFLKLLQFHMATTDSDGPDRKKSNLVLQIVPLAFIASRTTIAVPQPKDYTKLAFNVYDRCLPIGNSQIEDDGTLAFTSTPAFILAGALPKTIGFSLTEAHSGSLMNSNRSFHVAYSWHCDGKWLSAAFTEDLGAHQWSSSFEFGPRRISAKRHFFVIAKEIWETMLGIINIKDIRKRSWRVFIVKDTVMSAFEIEAWTCLEKKSADPAITLSLLSVNPHPSLSFSNDALAKIITTESSILTTTQTLLASQTNTATATKPAPFHHSNIPTSSPTSTTPPKPDPPSSPCPSTHAATSDQSAPSATFLTPTGNLLYPPDTNPPSGSKLIDPSDETWSLILSNPYLITHNNTATPTTAEPDCTPSLATGHLLKRAGTRDEDGLSPLEVHLLYTGTSNSSGSTSDKQPFQHPSHYQTLLKEILVIWRGLAALARARGVVHPVRGVLPWHVAVARRARVGLDALM